MRLLTLFLVLMVIVACTAAQNRRNRGGRSRSFSRGRNRNLFNSRSGRNFRRGGRNGGGSNGGVSQGYDAPLDTDPISAGDSYDAGTEPPQDTYQSDYNGAASDLDTAAVESGDPAIAMLEASVPGIPGEDYPIYAEIPETAFECDDAKVSGGYYADPEGECQVFHICADSGRAGLLTKYSFLCPNGTLFNQNYFICDWYFNVNCEEAEDLYSRNDEIAAEREELDTAASSAGDGYAIDTEPVEYDYQGEDTTDSSLPSYEGGSNGSNGVQSGYEAPDQLGEYNNGNGSNREERRFRSRGGRNRGSSRRSGRRLGRRPGRQNRRGGRRFRG